MFNSSGPAVALLLLTTILAAFVGGILLKGKSGWCSTLCPLLPVQRLYGQTPFATLPNSHCQPCVGCTKNCYDFNPGVAYQADMYDTDQSWSAPRKLFAGAFPGLIVAYVTLPSPPAISRFAVYTLVSAGSFFALDSIVRISTPKLAAVYATASFNTFYWYSSRSSRGRSARSRVPMGAGLCGRCACSSSGSAGGGWYGRSEPSERS